MKRTTVATTALQDVQAIFAHGFQQARETLDEHQHDVLVEILTSTVIKLNTAKIDREHRRGLL